MTFVLIISVVEHGVFNKSAVLMHYCVPVFPDPVLTCKQPAYTVRICIIFYIGPLAFTTTIQSCYGNNAEY